MASFRPVRNVFSLLACYILTEMSQVVPVAQAVVALQSVTMDHTVGSFVSKYCPPGVVPTSQDLAALKAFEERSSLVGWGNAIGGDFAACASRGDGFDVFEGVSSSRGCGRTGCWST